MADLRYAMNDIKEREGENKNEEGKHVPYKDQAGYWTIGYGTRINPEDVERFKSGVSDEEAKAMMSSHAEEDDKILQSVIKGKDYTPAQVDSLRSLMYNIGPSAFVEDTGLKQAILSGNKIKVANAIREYNKVTDPETKEKVESEGLTKRREEEASAFLPEKEEQEKAFGDFESDVAGSPFYRHLTEAADKATDSDFAKPRSTLRGEMMQPESVGPGPKTRPLNKVSSLSQALQTPSTGIKKDLTLESKPAIMDYSGPEAPRVEDTKSLTNQTGVASGETSGQPLNSEMQKMADEVKSSDTPDKAREYLNSLGFINPTNEQESQLNQKLEEAKKLLEDRRTQVKWGQVAERIGNALVLLFSAQYGLKHGIDATSGIKFDKADWASMNDEINQDFSFAVREIEGEKSRMDRLKEEYRNKLLQIKSAQAREEAKASKANTPKPQYTAKERRDQANRMEAVMANAEKDPYWMGFSDRGDIKDEAAFKKGLISLAGQGALVVPGRPDITQDMIIQNVIERSKKSKNPYGQAMSDLQALRNNLREEETKLREVGHTGEGTKLPEEDTTEE